MEFLISSAFAQGAPAGSSSPFSPLIIMVIFFGIFYFIAIRPQMKRAKEHRAMLAQIAKGDEIVTSGGIAGRVDEIGESFVQLEIAPGVSVKLQKHAVGAVLPKGTLKSV